MVTAGAVTNPELLAELNSLPPEEAPMAPTAPEGSPVAPKGAVTDPSLLAQLNSGGGYEPTEWTPEIRDDTPETNGIKEWLSQRGTKAVDTVASMTGMEQEQGDILGIGSPRGLGAVEGGVQLAGNAAQSLGEAAFNTVAAATPDMVKDPLKAGIASAFEALKSTSGGQKAIRYAIEGGKRWEAYAKANPQTAKTIGAAIELGLMAVPGPKGFKVKMPFRKKIGETLENSLTRTDRRRGKAFDRILADDSLLKGKGDVTVSGPEKYVGREPTTWEMDRNGVVASVKGTSKNKLDAENHILVRDAARAEREALEARILKEGNNAINKDQLTDELFKMQENILKSDELFSLRGNKEASKWTEDLMYKAYDLVHQSDGTALGVLQARRDFDDWVEKAAGGYDVDRITGKNFATREIRNKLNDVVEEAVPGAGVRESLNKQSMLLDARDRFLVNADKVGRDIPERVVESISSKFHVGPVGLKSIAAGATSWLAIGPAATLGLGAAVVVLSQMPRLKRNRTIATAISKIGKAMKYAKAEPLKELTIQRAYLIELMKELNALQEEQQDGE